MQFNQIRVLVLSMAGALLLAACSDIEEPTGPTDAPQLAEVEASAFNLRPEEIRTRHLVRFKSDAPSLLRRANVAEKADELTGSFGGVTRHTFSRSLKGYSVANLPPHAVEQLRQHPLVDLVVEIQPAKAATATPTSSWALDRIDQFTPSLDGQFNSNYNGSGVHIYIIDSGIDDNHSEFAGRIGNGKAFINLAIGADPYNDSNGHGTSVASAAAGATLGVAPAATVHSVRIQDGSNWSWPDDMIAGLEWVADNAIQPAVANLSYTTDPYPWPFEGMVKDAVIDVLSSGVVLTKSAGNVDQDACNDQSNTTSAIVVSGTRNDGQDSRSLFGGGEKASYGSCVLLFAPASNVTVATSGGGSTGKYGTSFAAPLAAGVAALIKQQYPLAGNGWVREVLWNSATVTTINDAGPGSPNRFLDAYHSWAWIEGPAVITQTGQHTWDAKQVGGNGGWSFTWHESIDGGPYQQVGTGSSYTKNVSDVSLCSEVLLRLGSTTNGETFNFVHDYRIEPPSGMCQTD